MSAFKRYANLNVVVTGDTGFKGSWLAWWLVRLGARVSGFALPPEHRRGPYVLAGLREKVAHTDGDIRDLDRLSRAVRLASPDVVFHLAAQPIVRASYRDPIGTAATNILGTMHVLEAVRRLRRPCAVVVITSDKCYENREWAYAYRENDPMGGHDPYSASKGCAEIMTSSFRRSFFDGSEVRVATARAGNVIGPGDWSVDRIVPYALRALMRGKTVGVRNPGAVRPWQYLLDPLTGYLQLGLRLLAGDGARFCEAWNFGPRPDTARTVRYLVEEILSVWGKGRWRSLRRAGQPHEAGYLRLAIDRAMSRLDWRPLWDFEMAVFDTVDGYRALAKCARDPKAARAVLDKKISEYQEYACAEGLRWAQPDIRLRIIGRV